MTKTTTALPAGWKTIRIGEAGKVQLGRQRSPQHHDGEHMRPYLRVANVYEDRIDTTDVKEMNFTPKEFERFRLVPGDILLNEGQSPELVGRPAMYRGEVEGACFQNTLVRFQATEGVEPKYALFYFLDCLHSRRFQAIASQTTNIAHLGLKRFVELDFPLAPLAEQRRIVDAIEALFSDLGAGVQALKTTKRQLARYRQSVLNAAVAGDLTTDWRAANPDAEPAGALLDRLRDERLETWKADTLSKYESKGKTPTKGWESRYSVPEPLSADDLPQVPDRWAWTTLEHVTSGARLVQYGILKPGTDIDGGVPYVKVMNMRGDRIDVDGLRKTTPEISAEYDRASLRKGDLLLSIRGTYGRVAVVPDVLDGGNITQDSVRIAPGSGVERDYLALHLRGLTTQNFFKAVAKGVAVKGVNVGDVRLTPIALPPTAEQAAIVEAVEERLSVADAVARDVDAQLARAVRLRRGILQRAFEGRLVPQNVSAPAEAPGRQIALAFD